MSSRTTDGYMLFDSSSGNAIGSYESEIDARVALRRCVEDDPSSAEDLVIIGYDAAGMPTGRAQTFENLPPSSFTVNAAPFLAVDTPSEDAE